MFPPGSVELNGEIGKDSKNSIYDGKKQSPSNRDREITATEVAGVGACDKTTKPPLRSATGARSTSTAIYLSSSSAAFFFFLAGLSSSSSPPFFFEGLSSSSSPLFVPCGGLPAPAFTSLISKM